MSTSVKELREGFQITEGVNQTTGTRVFISGSGTTLPEIGDALSVEFPASICTSIQRQLYHIDDSTCNEAYKYICSYSTKSSASTLAVVDKTDADQFIFSGGSEMVSIENPKDWFWLPFPGGDKLPTTRYKGRLFKNTVRGSLSKTRTFSQTDFPTFIVNTVFPKIGKINSLGLEAASWGVDFNIGTLLFSNFDARLVLDATGTKEWEVTMNFAYRILDRELGSVPYVGDNVNHSWNFYLYPDLKGTGQDDWQMVTNKDSELNAVDFNTRLVYKTTQFDPLLTA